MAESLNVRVPIIKAAQVASLSGFPQIDTHFTCEALHQGLPGKHLMLLGA